MDNYTQDRIDAYIRGEMSAIERTHFTKELSNDIELRKDYEFTKTVANFITDRERKKQQIKEWNRKKHKKSFMYTTITSIAAMFIVGFFLFHNYPVNNQELTTEEHPILTSKMYNDFTKISQLITDQNYAVALQYIEKAERNSLTIVNDSTLHSGSKNVLENRYELKQFKVRALLGLKRTEDACVILKELSNSNSQYKEWADSLCMELQ